MAYHGVGLDSNPLFEDHHFLMLVSRFGEVVGYVRAVVGDGMVYRLELEVMQMQCGF